MFETDSERINAAIAAFRVSDDEPKSRNRELIRHRVQHLAVYSAHAYLIQCKHPEATPESRAVAEIRTLTALESLKGTYAAILQILDGASNTTNTRGTP